MTRRVRTRIAPSPTGFLHLGTARTALFSWAFARHHGGDFVLRIEDTDEARSTQDAVDQIVAAMKWLRLDWDDGPFFQMQRLDRYREVIAKMLIEGTAYRCYCSPEELDAMREAQRARGDKPRYDGRWRDRDPSEAPPGMKSAIRLKAPITGETVIEDHVQGRVVFQNENLDDFVLLRSDGTPTYMLAVVVDDHDMGITHVIRGDDHLANAPRQKQIYDAMGWTVPQMAHIPLIHGPDGAKLSKRHGALGVEAYRAMGYLPVTMRNYLARLGWSHGDQEIFSTEELIAAFDLAQVGRSPARLDLARLDNLNGHYIRKCSDSELLVEIERILPHIAGGQELAAKLAPELRQRLLAAMPGLKERAKTLIELIEGARYLWSERPLQLDEKAAGVLTAEARVLLRELTDDLGAVDAWTAGATEQAVRAFAERKDTKLANVAQPLRAALTGRTTSPPIFDVLAVLGRNESLARLRDQVQGR